MEAKGLKVLLIDHNPADARLIRGALAEATETRFHLECVVQLAEAFKRLRNEAIDVVLLDLTLPDVQGIGAFDQVFLAMPSVPILILSDLNDEAIAMQAVQRGAQDYIAKSQVDGYWLPRALRYVIERKAADSLRKSAEHAAFQEKERLQLTLDSIGDAVATTDTLANITYLNAAAEQLTGWSRRDALGQPLSEVFHIVDGVTREPALSQAELALRMNKVVGMPGNSVLIRRDGLESGIADSAAPVHDRAGHVTGAVVVFHDVSESRGMAVQMSYMAQHDSLTDLPNRALLNDRLDRAIAMARRHDNRLALLFLDLDRFQHVNDSLGHALGDKLLQSVAERLAACVRSSDTVCRLGGDEFLVLLPKIQNAQDAASIAEKIHAALTMPHNIHGHELHVSMSIGISIYPDDGLDVDGLIKSADTAMYHAKQSGRNNHQFFVSEMNARAVERHELESSLRGALTRQELVLQYQKKVDLKTGVVTGAEALIRWRHPVRGLIPPAQFIPIAEDCGLIVPIGQWLLREACRQVKAWLDQGLQAVPVAVNISAVEFRNKNFLKVIDGILKETGLDARYLELELTESVLMEEADSTASVLRKLKRMGVRLAIDDFGTGYSSLSYLRRFPIDALKIDQSFVRNITTATRDATIVCAVISMAKRLKQRVIAEGVETAEQFAFLRAQHCNEGQGYYLGRPAGAEVLAALLPPAA